MKVMENGSVIDLSARRKPVLYTVEIEHGWDDTIGATIHGISEDERSRAAAEDAVIRLADVLRAKRAQDTGDWKCKAQADLEAAIAEFKAALPGWWYSVCECQVSCDASCAPTTESPYINLVREAGDEFDAGFHADLRQPSSLAEALRDVMEQALSAIEARLALPTQTGT